MTFEQVSRRQFVTRTAVALSGMALAGCAGRSRNESANVASSGRWGLASEYERLRRVLVHAPSPAVGALPTPADLAKYNFDAQLDHARSLTEHAALTQLLTDQGAEVLQIRDVLASDRAAVEAIDADPNFMFTRDIMTMTPKGALLMRMGLPARRPEVTIVAKALERLGIPIAYAIESPGTLEGGSVLWLEPGTLIVGNCDRVNDDAIRQLRRRMPDLGVTTLVVANIPGHIHIDGLLAVPGPGTVFVRPAAFEKNKADVFTRSSHRERWFLEELASAGQQLISLDRICNEIYTAPFVGVAVSAWSREAARDALEARGGRLSTFEGGELIKGNGGAHCLTCPLWRQA